jgi:16S rRNA (cytosine967-C5)-methyltransferase
MAERPRLDDAARRTARGLAFEALDEHHRGGAFVAETLDRCFREFDTPANERRLATQLATGVLRRALTLDALIAARVERPRHRVENELWTLLQLGTFQLVLLDGLAPHAAIHATVELTKQMGRPQWTGFVNGVLRGMARMVSDDLGDAPAANALPLPGGRFRLFDQPVFPDPAAEPLGYVSAAFGLPRWLVDRWASRFDFDGLVRIGFWFDAPPTTTLRVNRLRTKREDLLAAFHAAGVAAEAGGHAEAVRLLDSIRVDALPGFEEGWFAVQDESAMTAADLLAPQPGERVLDLCAAPGTKTTHLAEWMQNTGTLLATDVDDRRLARVAENAVRLGHDVIETRLIANDPATIPAGPFDAILVDVPCSNTGVLGKRPEVRGRLSQRDFVELPALQQSLLIAALDRLAPGGRVVYSTCSIEPEENAGVVAAAIAERPVTLVREIEHGPGAPADGAYQALLVRSTN